MKDQAEQPASQRFRPRRRERIAQWLKEALIRDALLAGLVALITGLLTGHVITENQAKIDDARANREQASSDEQFLMAIRLENFRFVRDRSSSAPDVPRNFMSLDLTKMPLKRLSLDGADFEDAVLEGANLYRLQWSSGTALRTNFRKVQAWRGTFRETDFSWTYMEGADFGYSDLRGSEFIRVAANGANFQGADFRGAKILNSDLRRANFEDADLSGATMFLICHDDSTRWPDGFSPPPSAREEQCTTDLSKALADPEMPFWTKPPSAGPGEDPLGTAPNRR